MTRLLAVLLVSVAVPAAAQQHDQQDDDHEALVVRVTRTDGAPLTDVRSAMEPIGERVARCRGPIASFRTQSYRVSISASGEVLAVSAESVRSDDTHDDDAEEDRAMARLVRCVERALWRLRLGTGRGQRTAWLEVQNDHAPMIGLLGVLGSASSGTVGASFGPGVGGIGGLRGTTLGQAGTGTSGPAQGASQMRAAPVVRNGAPTVQGSLDRDVIRRVIRRHINEVRFCYEQQLAQDPQLSGRVAVRFTISATGQVTAAQITSTTLQNANVEQCITRAVRRWRFPAPRGGGVVVVTYPFILQSSTP